MSSAQSEPLPARDDGPPPMSSPPERGALHEILLALGLLELIFWTQFAWVRPTNFGGIDEWLLLSLFTKGILGMPTSHRPLVFLWYYPAAALAPNHLWAYHLVQALYLSACGWFTYLLARRLLPGSPFLAFLTGVFTLVWLPTDGTRLATVATIAYPACVSMIVLAMLLLLESYRRGSIPLLGGAVALAAVCLRSYEGVAGLAACAPVVLWLGGGRGRRLWIWVGAWELPVLVSLAFVAWPVLVPGLEGSYQASVLGLDRGPLSILVRLAGFYYQHLSPLVISPPGSLASVAVPVAVVASVAGCGLVWRLGGGKPLGSEPRRLLLGAALVGLLFAGAGYGPFALSSGIEGPHRVQLFGAPGIGLLLASSIGLVCTGLRPRWRPACALALVSWIVAAGTGATVALQEFWDYWSYYPAQARMLRGLTTRVPDVAPGTLVILAEPGWVWPAGFTFRHAVELFYDGRATGLAWRAQDLLYTTRFEPDGIRCEPIPPIRKGWGETTTMHDYDETIVVRPTGSGGVRVLDEWPDMLPPLPPGALYEPAARIRRRRSDWPQLRLLEQPTAGLLQARPSRGSS